MLDINGDRTMLASTAIHAARSQAEYATRWQDLTAAIRTDNPDATEQEVRVAAGDVAS